MVSSQLNATSNGIVGAHFQYKLSYALRGFILLETQSINTKDVAGGERGNIADRGPTATSKFLPAGPTLRKLAAECRAVEFRNV